MFTLQLPIVPSREAMAGVIADSRQFTGEIVLPRQTHTTNIALLPDDSPLSEIPPFDDTDALISFRTDCAIGIRTADCVPVLLYAPDIHAVAAIHAGWRGTIGGIVSLAVKKLTELGAAPEAMKAAIGPAICSDCYEVDTELADRFADAGFGEFVTRHPDRKPHLDLPGINRFQLTRCGLPDASIHNCGICTLSTPALPSWRREPGIESRLLTWIRLLPREAHPSAN